MVDTPLHIETPLVESAALSARLGVKVWLKLEALQPSGSFKLRGVGNACRHHARLGAQRLICSSGGNAGIAVAYAGRRLGVPVTVVVPESTSNRAVTAIREEQAEVVVYGSSWQEAHQHALTLSDRQSAYIHPFDDPLLWDGHATLIDEVSRAGVIPDLVVLSVGGGGLLCGVIEGLRRNGLAAIPVLAVETAGADSLAASLASGALVELPAITSLATTLGAKQVCWTAFDWCSRHHVASHVVTDRQAVEACLSFSSDHRLLVEPACGAALAPLYQNVEQLAGKSNILVIVCGGAGVDLEQLQTWKNQVGC